MGGPDAEVKEFVLLVLEGLKMIADIPGAKVPDGYQHRIDVLIETIKDAPLDV